MDTPIGDNWNEFLAHLVVMGKKLYLYTYFADQNIDALMSPNQAYCESQNKIDELIHDFNLKRNLNTLKVDKTLVEVSQRRKRLPPGGSLEQFGSEAAKKQAMDPKDLVFNALTVQKDLHSELQQIAGESAKASASSETKEVLGKIKICAMARYSENCYWKRFGKTFLGKIEKVDLGRHQENGYWKGLGHIVGTNR